MRTKILAIKKSIALLVSRQNYASKSSDRVQPHMNDLPVPRLPWDKYYNEKQTFYNIHLLLGALNLVFALAVVMYTESMYLNWGPPKYPSPPSDMVEECDDGDIE